MSGFYTVRPGTSSQSSGFFVAASTAAEALGHVGRMEALGLTGVHVLDARGDACARADLEQRQILEAGPAGQSTARAALLSPRGAALAGLRDVPASSPG